MILAQDSTSGDDAATALPFPVLSAWRLPCLVHGFMTREGGVSRGPYHSLNLADRVGDDSNSVSANRARWHAAYPQMQFARLQQVHGTRVQRIDSDTGGERRIGDGMVSRSRGIALAIFTADCVPVLMVDIANEVVGALHAGWRGTLAGIAREGIGSMATLGARPEQIRVALGPSIGSCCFEVDAELAARFVLDWPATGSCWRPGRAGKKHLDLRGILRLQLLEAGVGAGSIGNIGPCTRCESNRFFSRRAAGGATTGLQMSFIGFEPKP